MTLIGAVASAGYYQTTYSGGYAKKTLSNGLEQSVPYVQQSFGGYRGDVPLSYAGEHASLEDGFTATFQWYPSYVGEPAPKVAVLKQVCTVSWVGSGGTADNTLGSPYIPGSESGRSSGDKFEVIDSPGTSFTRMVKPTGTAFARLAGAPYPGGLLTFNYTADVAPVAIEFTGTTTPSSNPGKQFALIGQRIKAKLTCIAKTTASSGSTYYNLATFSDYAWDVLGERFKKWEKAEDDTSADPPAQMSASDWMSAEPEWVWLDGRSKGNATPLVNGETKVAITASVKNGSTIIGNASLDKFIKVFIPESELIADIRNQHIFKGGPSATTIYAAFYEDGLEYGAATFRGKVFRSDNAFTDSGNTWLFVQTLTTSRIVGPSPPPFGVDLQEPSPCLDGGFPYSKNSAANGGGPFPWGATLRETGDNPRQGLGDNFNYNLHDEFQMTMMFLPFDSGLGSEYVPLRAVKWQFIAIGERTSVYDPWPSPLTRTVKSLGDVKNLTHPTWVKIQF